MNSQPQRFRKKPVVIEAMQYRVGHSEAIVDWSGARFILVTTNQRREDDPNEFIKERVLAIQTLEGDMVVSPDDYVIRVVQGEFYEFYPCKPDIFAATYEAVDA